MASENYTPAWTFINELFLWWFPSRSRPNDDEVAPSWKRNPVFYLHIKPNNSWYIISLAMTISNSKSTLRSKDFKLKQCFASELSYHANISRWVQGEWIQTVDIIEDKKSPRLPSMKKQRIWGVTICVLGRCTHCRHSLSKQETHLDIIWLFSGVPSRECECTL